MSDPNRFIDWTTEDLKNYIEDLEKKYEKEIQELKEKLDKAVEFIKTLTEDEETGECIGPYDNLGDAVNSAEEFLKELENGL